MGSGGVLPPHYLAWQKKEPHNGFLPFAGHEGIKNNASPISRKCIIFKLKSQKSVQSARMIL